jgi:hypothetical protein
MTEASTLAPHEQVLGHLESISERRVGHGEQIEFVRLPSSLELAPVRRDLAPIGIFATPESLDLLIGSIVHESLVIDASSVAEVLEESSVLLTAALDGRLREQRYLLGGRLLFGAAELEAEHGVRHYEQGFKSLRHLARREDVTFRPYPGSGRLRALGTKPDPVK